jgi:glycosyltransferase involved in cell wall biosynthesis
LAGRALARLGQRVAARADLTVVADTHLLEGAPRRLVARNTPDLAMLPEAAGPDARPRALYVGDLRPSRGLFAMLEALALAPQWRLDLVGPVREADQSRLEAFLEGRPGLAERVCLHGRRPPKEAWSLARGAWAGLSLLEDTTAFRDAMPSKVYEYLACGLPVLTTPLPRPAELVAKTGAGAVVAGPAQAAAVLRRWAEDPDEHSRVARAAAAAGRQVRRDAVDMDRLAAAVRRLASLRPGRAGRPVRPTP